MKRILIATTAMMLVLAMIGAGTLAFFTDTGTSSANAFTAGTLTLKLSNDASTWTDGVTGTWKSAAWAPGDKVTATIYLKNPGTVNAHVVYGDFNALTESVAGLSDHIFVTSWKDSYPWASGSNNPYGDEYIGNQKLRWDTSNDGNLSLRELVLAVYKDTTPALGRGPGDFESIWSADDTFGLSEPHVLPAGGTLGIRLEFQLDPATGDAFQGASAAFNLDLMASQVLLTPS